MKIIIDINVIHILLDVNHSSHQVFKILIKYLNQKKIIWVYGGTTYKKELSKLKNEDYKKYLVNLRKAGILVDLKKDEEIDIVEKDCYKILSKSRTFDDAHIIAIIIIGKCMILVSNDKKAVIHFKDKRFYGKNNKIPKIYTNEKHFKKMFSKRNS